MEMNVIEIDSLAPQWGPLVVFMKILTNYRTVLFPARSRIGKDVLFLNA
jgi:hypothetical protein